MNPMPRSFTQPMVSIVTNVDADHMATYGGDFERLKSTVGCTIYRFMALRCCVLTILMCVGCVTKLNASLSLTALMKINYRIVDFSQQAEESFTALRPGDAAPLAIRLAMPGRHNALNAMAAIVVATDAGVSDAIQRGLTGSPG